MKYNFDNVYLRDLIVAMLGELNNRIYWTNHWSDESRKIDVPFFYSMTGGDDFLIDSFIDDTPGRRIDMNYDPIPRGVISLDNWRVKDDELTNPHIEITPTIEADENLKRIIAKVQPLPLICTFSVKIKVASEVDLFKLTEALWNLLYQYQYFDFEHQFMRIEGFFRLNPENQTEIVRDVNMDSPIYPQKDLTLDVHTYYPSLGQTRDIPLSNKVDWKAYFWKLGGSGRQSMSRPRNSYPQPPSNVPKLVPRIQKPGCK